MCVRDSHRRTRPAGGGVHGDAVQWADGFAAGNQLGVTNSCLLYTSDAADERSSVDLGGRRIIKKKKMREIGRVCVAQLKKKARIQVSNVRNTDET